MKKLKSNNPSSIFYWKDHEGDEALRVSSLAAQGLWMRLLACAAKAEPYGYLLISGKNIDNLQVARLVGISEAEAEALMAELGRNGVYSRDRKGRMFCRRMVKEGKLREKNHKNGKLGGNPKLNASNRKKTKISESVNPPLNPPVNPPYPTTHSPSDTSYLQKEQEQPSANAHGFWNRDNLLAEVRSALGLNDGHVPNWWQPPSAADHVWRWHTKLGLSPEIIIAAAAENRKRHSEPPDGPKALDRLMERQARAMQQSSGSVTRASPSPKCVDPEQPSCPISFDTTKFKDIR